MGRSEEAKDLSSNQGNLWMRVTGDAPEGDAPRDAGEGERLHYADGHDGISRWQEAITVGITGRASPYIPLFHRILCREPVE